MPCYLANAFDGLVLLQVRIVLVLDVVIERKNQLLGILDLLRPDGLELLHHRRSVVVRHDVVRTDGDEVPGPQRPLRPFGQVCLRDLLNDGLAHTSPVVRTLSFATTMSSIGMSSLYSDVILAQ